MDISRNENDAITTIVLGVLAVVVLIAKSEYAVYVIVAIISILGGALGGGRMDTKKLLQIFQQLQGASGSDGSSVVEDAAKGVEDVVADKLQDVIETTGIKASESQDVSGEEDAQAVDEASNKEQAQAEVDNSVDATSQDASVDNSSSSNNADQTAQPATTEQAATVTLSDDQMADLASRVTANMVKNQGSASTNDAGAAQQ